MAPKLSSSGISVGQVVTKKELAPPPSDTKAVMGAVRASGGDYPDRLGQPVCQYYMKTGMCKFGAFCKYHHPSQGGGSSMPTALNICGYPLRQGEKDCSYYVKKGRCKFGVNCKFNHPQPTGVQGAAPGPTSGICPTVLPNQQHGVPSGNYPAPVSPATSASTQPNVRASPIYDVMQLSPQAPANTGHYVLVSSFPAPSGSSPMSDYFADLPQEVLSDILIRLPLKSIGRSRCVSKPWLSLLTSYEFTKAHLAHHHTHLAQEQKLLLCSSSDSLFSLTLHLGGNHLRKLEFFDKPVYKLVGSCNGLVLVLTRGFEVLLINSMTKEYVKLPDSPFPLCRDLCFKKYGFVYDSLSDDYKVVKVSQCDYSQFFTDEPNCPEIYVDIYSLKMRSWKRLGTPFYGHDLPNYDPCVFINGAFHWIGLKSSHEIIVAAFDLSSETLKEIPVPAAPRVDFAWGKLKVIDGCLGIVVTAFGGQKTEIWLMKSYSLVESWTKLVLDMTTLDISHMRPLCFHEDKILFQPYRDLQWYCPKNGRVELCLVTDDRLGSDEGITYSESLVSPHFFSQN